MKENKQKMLMPPLFRRPMVLYGLFGLHGEVGDTVRQRAMGELIVQYWDDEEIKVQLP